MSTATLESTTPFAERPSGGVWDYISASRLNLWLKCPLAFKLRYVDGIRTPTTPNLFLGRRVHDALEVHYRHCQVGVRLATHDVAERLLNTWDEAAVATDVTFSDMDQSAAMKQKGPT